MFVSAGLGAPIPEEVAIVGAGIWAATHGAEYPLYRWLMLPVCITGVIIADMLLYGIGRRYGTRLLEWRWTSRFVPSEKRQRIERNFHRYGVNILVFGRLLPGIRTPLFLTAGIMRLSIARFLLADGIGAIVGNSLLFFLAFWFGDQFKELVDVAEGTVDRIKPLLFLLLIGGVGLYFLYHFLRTPLPTGDPEELPLIGKQVAARIDSAEIRIRKPEQPKAQEPATNHVEEPSPKSDHLAHLDGRESK
jgi:membrane protein DedA with SNARE-associated domain